MSLLTLHAQLREASVLGGGVLDLQCDGHASAVDALLGLSLVDVQHEIAVAEREACDARLVGRELAADLVAIERLAARKIRHERQDVEDAV